MPATINLTYTTDLDCGVHQQVLRSAMLTGDREAHRISVRCVRGGKPVDLTGAGVQAYFVRADQSTVIVDGSASGNVATVTLPADCYAMRGVFSLVVKVSGVDNITSILWLIGTVGRSRTDMVIDPENVMPTLDELLAQIDAMEAATDAAWAAVDVINGNAAVLTTQWEQGYVSTSGAALGTERDASNFVRTGYIDVSRYATIILMPSAGYGTGCVLYDASQTPLTGYAYSNESERVIDLDGAAYARINLRADDSADITVADAGNITMMGRYTTTGTPLPDIVDNIANDVANLKDHTGYAERDTIAPVWAQGYVSTSDTAMGVERESNAYIRTDMISVVNYGTVLIRLDDGWGCGYVLYDSNRVPVGARGYNSAPKQDIDIGGAAYIRINLRADDSADINTSAAQHIRIYGAESSSQTAPLRILCLGNSWLRDPCVYLWSILSRAGINAIVGNAFAGNKGIRDFYYGMIDPSYTFSGTAVKTSWTYYKWDSDDRKTMSANTLQAIIEDEAWDIIIINNNVWLHGIPDAWTTDGNAAYTPSYDQGDGSYTVNAFIGLVKSAVEQAHDKAPAFALMTPWTYADGTAMEGNASWMISWYLDYHDIPTPQTQAEWDALYAHAHATFQRTAPQLAALLGDDCIGIINLGEPIRLARNTGLYDDIGYKLQYNNNDYAGAKTAGTHLTEGIGRYITSAAMAYELCNISRDAVRWYPKTVNTIRTEGGQAVSKSIKPTDALAAIGRRCAYVGTLCTSMEG